MLILQKYDNIWGITRTSDPNYLISNWRRLTPQWNVLISLKVILIGQVGGGEGGEWTQKLRAGKAKAVCLVDISDYFSLYLWQTKNTYNCIEYFLLWLRSRTVNTKRDLYSCAGDKNYFNLLWLLVGRHFLDVSLIRFKLYNFYFEQKNYIFDNHFVYSFYI